MSHIAIQVRSRTGNEQRARARGERLTKSSSAGGWQTIELLSTEDQRSQAYAHAAKRVADRFPLQHFAHRTVVKNPATHHHIPKTTVKLGTVLDLVTELSPTRTTWETELAGWQLLTDPEAMESRAGSARLYLVRGELADNTAEQAPARAAKTYERWHQRQPERVGELDTPDLVGVYIGTALRIGYRSDKWNERGAFIDYDHDFAERRHRAPEAWADTAELERARAIVIVGGDMKVTPEGID